MTTRAATAIAAIIILMADIIVLVPGVLTVLGSSGKSLFSSEDFMKYRVWLYVLAVAFSRETMSRAEEPMQDIAQLGEDALVQGEYVGELDWPEKRGQFGLQVIAYGHGVYRAVLYYGGLPGDGWKRGDKKEEAMGITRKSGPFFTTPDWAIKIKDGVASFNDSTPRMFGELKKITRESPTAGAKPPADAIVLFDGKDTETFQPGAQMTPEGLLKQGANTVEQFQSFTLHLEFRLPLMLEALGQSRGNSGVYPQGRYEVQILDSFGLEGRHNECGGIYKTHEPLLNMCFPPMAWQTYDIDYTAAKYEGGSKVKHARITVKQNGVMIHENVELPAVTPSAPNVEGPEAGMLHLQNHNAEVRFRNVWIVKK